MDHKWAYERKCKEAAQELYDELVSDIASGKGLPDVHDKLFEAADAVVPIYTNELYNLVEYLDDQWDEVDKSATFFQAVTQAVWMKTTDLMSDDFGPKEARLNELSDAYDAIKEASTSGDRSALKEALELYASEAEELGMNNTPARPTMGGPK